jgi:Domain of unknown function (DUF4062)/NB-ARC domain
MSTVLPPLRVFLSSTDIDLHAHRTAALDIILRWELLPLDMRFFGAQATGTATTVSVDGVDRADLVILLIAWRYGTPSDGSDLSITHREYREAKARHLPILVYLADDATEADETLFPLPQRKTETAHQLRAFREEARAGGKVVERFTTPDDLAKKIATDLGKYLLDMERQQRQERFARRIPHNLPPRASTFVGHKHELAQIEADLRRGTNVPVAAAIVGMGGVGKSALAAEILAHIASDETAFPGGITWIRCNDLTGWEGINSIYAQLLVEWEIAVPPEKLASASTPQQEAQIRAQALRSRLVLPGSALVLLDNVEHDLPFKDILTLLDTLRMTALVTSRTSFSLPTLKPWKLEVLPPNDAVALFRNCYTKEGRIWHETRDTDIAQIVVAIFNYLPLDIVRVAPRVAQLRINSPFSSKKKTMLAFIPKEYQWIFFSACIALCCAVIDHIVFAVTISDTMAQNLAKISPFLSVIPLCGALAHSWQKKYWVWFLCLLLLGGSTFFVILASSLGGILPYYFLPILPLLFVGFRSYKAGSVH